MRRGLQWSLVAAGVISVWLATPDSAYALQGHHGATQDGQWLLAVTGIAHGLTQGAAVFLAGLAAFAVLVWLPEAGTRRARRERHMALGAWAMFGLLLAAGTVDLALYAVRASGQSFSLGLFGEALFETRTGRIWFARTGLGLLTAVLVERAVRSGRGAYWWGAAAAGGALLFTLSLQSHAAAEDGALPLLSNWLHVVAGAVWMGGLLGFPALLLGPLREPPSERRTELLRRVVRRFSKVATVSVMVIVATGVHAILMNVPDAATLISTSYGRALVMKLGLFVLLLAAGGINLIDRGKGPLGRMVGAELALSFGIFLAAGFLTILPPTG